MAGERTIGEAFVGIRPDTSEFATQLQAAVQRALHSLRDLSADIPGLNLAVREAVEQGLGSVNWNQAAQRFQNALTGEFTSLGRAVDAAFAPALARAREAAALVATLGRASPGQSAFGERAGVGFATPAVSRLFVPNLPAGEQLGLDLGRVSSWGRAVRHTLIDEAFKPAEEQLGAGIGTAVKGALGGVGSMLAGAARQFGSNLAGQLQFASQATAVLRSGLGSVASGFGSSLRTVLSGAGSFVASGIRGAGALIHGALDATIRPALAGIGIAGGVLLAAGVAKAIQGINLGAGLDQARRIFDNLIGSTSLADATIKRLQDTAIETGNAFQPLADGAKQMLAVGLSAQQVTPALESASKFVTVFGTGASNELPRVTLALEQMGLKGRVMAEELRQLVNAGIPAYAILTKAAQLSGVAIDDNTAGFKSNQAAIDSVNKATLTLQQAQQHAALALKQHGNQSIQYADAVRSVQRAQINLDAAQRNLSNSTAKVTSGTQAAMQAMKEGRITVEAYLAAMSDPDVLKLAQGALTAMHTNLLFQLRVLRSVVSTGLGKFFEPVQSVIAVPLAGITDQLATLAKSDAFAKLGKQVAEHIPTAALTNMANAVSGLLDRIGEINSGTVDAALAKLQPWAPVIGGVAGAVAALALSFGSSLPFLGSFIPTINPLLGVIAGIVLAVPEARTGVLQLAQSLGSGLVEALRELQPLLKPLTDWTVRLTEEAKPLVAAIGRDLVLAAHALEPALESLIGWLGSRLVGAERGAVSALDSLGPAIDRVGSFILATVEWLERLGDAVGRGLAEAADIAGPALGRLVNTDVSGALRGIADAVVVLLPWLIELGATVLRDLADDFGPVVRMSGELLSNFLQLTPASEALNGSLEPLARTIEVLLVGFAVFRVGGAIWASLGALGTVLEGVGVGFGALIGDTALLAGGFGAVAAGGAIVAVLLLGLVAMFFQIKASIEEVQTAWNLWGDDLLRFFGWVGDRVGELVAWMGTLWERFSADPVRAVGFVIGFLVAEWLLLPVRAQELLTSLGAMLLAWLGSQKDEFLRDLAIVGEAITHIPDALLRSFTTTLTSYMNLFLGLWSSIQHIDWSRVGHAIWDGILGGLTAGVYTAIRDGTLNRLWQGLVEGFNAAGLGHSPYRLFEPVGANVVGGIGQGVDGAWADLVRQTRGLVGGLADVGGRDVALGAALPALVPAAAVAGGAAAAAPIYLTVHVAHTNASADDIGEAIGWKLSRKGVVRR
jgi:tape measure domain-containing protein